MKEQDNKLGGATGHSRCMQHQAELRVSYSSPSNYHLMAHLPRFSCHSTLAACLPPRNEAPRLAMYVHSYHPFSLWT